MLHVQQGGRCSNGAEVCMLHWGFVGPVSGRKQLPACFWVTKSSAVPDC